MSRLLSQMSFLKTLEIHLQKCRISYVTCVVSVGRKVLAEQYNEKMQFTVNLCSRVSILSIWWCRVRKLWGSYRIWVFSQGRFGSMHKTWSVLIRAKLGIFCSNNSDQLKF